MWRRRLKAAYRLGVVLSATGGLASAAIAQSPLSPPLFAPEASGPPPQTATLKTATDAVQRLTIPVMIDGKGPFQFVIDTGSNQSIITSALAASLSLAPGRPAKVQNAGGEDVEPTAMIGQLDVGARRLRNVSAPVLTAADVGASGMIGLDVLHNQRIVMDFEHKRLLVEPSPRSSSEPDAIVVYGRRRFGQLVLVDAAWEGRPIFVVLDSGAQDTVANAAFRRLAASRSPTPGPVTQTQLVSVTGRTIPAELSVVPEIRIGGVLIRNLSVAYADLHTFDEFDLTNVPAILLGMDVMRLFNRISIDFKHNEAHFVLPAGTSATQILSP